MSVLNKIVKGTFYPLLFIGLIFQSYVIGLVFSGAGLALVEAVWSIIKPLPAVLTNKAWLVYLISGIPVGLFVFFYTLIKVAVSVSKKHNKQGN